MLDAAVIGGGTMGCSTALHLARGGMRVAVIERRGLCMEASGVNAGTLSIQIKRADLIAYAMRARELWETAPDWLGMDIGYHLKGGLTLAFTDDEAEVLEARMGDRIAAGAPIEFMDAKGARKIDPGVSEQAVLVSHCPLDGYASSNLLGLAYRKALSVAGVELSEWNAVQRVEREAAGFVVHTASKTFTARRVVLALGVWSPGILRNFDLDFPVKCRVNQVSVTQRMPPIIDTIISVATGLLTLKQSENGTVLIGGAWQGIGDPQRGGYEVIPENLVGNKRLAHYVVPALAGARIVRTWLGLEANVPDFMPVVGPLPGIDDAYVITCVRGGFTIGPLMGRLLAQSILEQEPELPLFDPIRLMPGETNPYPIPEGYEDVASA